jgi:hypothetical protein
MVSVRPISELTVAPDGCFAFVGPCSSLTIKYEHPGGFGERQDFKAFAHPSGTIIRIEKTYLEQTSAWGLTAVLDTGEEYVLHLPSYEENYDFWENRPLRAHEFLGFLDSVAINSGTDANRALTVDGRCDAGMYGPRLHDVTDGIKPTPVDFSLFSSVFVGSPMLNINGVSHVTSQYIHGIDMSWRNWPCVTLAAKTLSGMLRQLCEWRDLYLAELTSEYYAEKAYLFIEALGITEEMIQELKESEVMMPTERFMRGYGNPRHGFVETGNLPSSIRNHLKKHLFYNTLSSLEAQHPSHPEIEQDLKTEEKEINQNNIAFYVNETIPTTPLSEVTTQDIYDSCFARGKYKNLGIVRFNHQTETVRNGLKAARFFDATS